MTTTPVKALGDHAAKPATRPTNSVALVLLGTNAWATSVGWTLLPADVRLRDAAFAASALVWLLLGAMLHARRASAFIWVAPSARPNRRCGGL